MRTSVIALVIGSVAGSGTSPGDASAPAGAPGSDSADLRTNEEIAEHRTYDRGPELQRTPGGSLIVDAFIMEGPVRVTINHRETGELLLEKESRSLFAFEVDGADLGAEPEEVIVRIYVDGEQAHELTLDR